MQDLLQELKAHGHVVLDGSRLVKLIDAEHIEFGFENGKSKENIAVSHTEDLELAMSVIHHELAREFIEPCTDNFQVSTRLLWESSPAHHKRWHNDSTEKNNDMFFLLYFTDHRESDDGALRFRNQTGEHRYVPFPGLLIAMENSDPRWSHMVETSTTRRIVASLGFKIDRA